MLSYRVFDCMIQTAAGKDQSWNEIDNLAARLPDSLGLDDPQKPAPPREQYGKKGRESPSNWDGPRKPQQLAARGPPGPRGNVYPREQGKVLMVSKNNLLLTRLFSEMHLEILLAKWLKWDFQPFLIEDALMKEKGCSYKKDDGPMEAT